MMTSDNDKKEQRYCDLLASLYTITCTSVLLCFCFWIGGTILFISLFTFGIPLFLMLLPALGGYMFKAKSWWSVLLSYLCSLTVLPALIAACQDFPLKRMVDEAPHYETLSATFSVIAVVTFSLFLIVATLSMIYCLGTYKNCSKMD